MIKNLKVENFKSWRNLDIEFGRVTGIFGRNSSGKSSILQFLLLLKQTRETRDRKTQLHLNGDYVELGTIKDCFFNHGDSGEMKWSLKFKCFETLEMVLNNHDNIDQEDIDSIGEIGSSVKINQNSFYCNSLKYYLANEQVPVLDYSIDIENHNYQFKVYNNSIETDEPIRYTNPIKSYLLPESIEKLGMSWKYFRIANSYEYLLDRIYYIKSLRQFPQRQYLWEGNTPSDVGLIGENTVAVIQRSLREFFLEPFTASVMGPMRESVRQSVFYPETKKDILTEISTWLQTIGLLDSFRLNEISTGSNLWQVLVKVDAQSPEVNLADVGIGISQILPIITQLFYMEEGSILLIEQPELHLHPSAQSVLADLFIKVSKERNLQIIVESHSEHFLTRLQRRIAEEKVSQKDVKLYFCETDAGKSRLVPLKLNEFGEINNWPKDFFGDAMGEAFAFSEAGLDRKIALKNAKK